VTESMWTRRRVDKHDRLSAIARYVDGKLIDPARLRDALEVLLRPGDRVALEGDNQKQADFLSRTLAQCDPGKVNGLHMPSSRGSTSQGIGSISSSRPTGRSHSSRCSPVIRG